MTPLKHLRPVGILASAALILSGCAGSTGNDTSEGDGIAVLASFYPLQFVAQQVGGDRVTVTSLTPPNIDPHNIELSPNAVAGLERADLVVHLAGFQPAVDDAVNLTGVTAFDAAEYADLLTTEEQHAHDDHADEGEDHADEADDDGHAHGPTDPHFWLDPVRLSDVAEALADSLAGIDPEGAEVYRDNAAQLTTELETLDDEYTTGLGQCAMDTIVVAHEAYGYLEARYGFHQEGLSGLDPESEPSPARLAEISEILEETGTTTIFTETLISSTVSQALAKDLGVSTAVLDPLENQQDAETGYLEVMRANLAAIRGAMACQ